MPDDINAGGDGDCDAKVLPRINYEGSSFDADGDGRLHVDLCAKVQPGGGMTVSFLGRRLKSQDGRL